MIKTLHYKKPYAEENPNLTCFCFKYCENITAE